MVEQDGQPTGVSRRQVLRAVGVGAAAIPLTGLLGGAPPAADAASGQALVDATPDQIGEWSAPFTGTADLIGVHAAMLHTGQVLLFFGIEPVCSLWDPVTGIAEELAMPDNLFCGGQCFLADGRLLVAGGAVVDDLGAGPPLMHSFDPVSKTWTRHADMRQGRYYPTTTLLSDGRVLITNGNTAVAHVLNEDLEVFDPSTNITSVVGSKKVGLYAHQALLPDGSVLVQGRSGTATCRILPKQWRVKNLATVNGNRAHDGGFIVPGPPSGSWTLMVTTGDHLSTTESMDASTASPTWQLRAPTPQIRSYMCTPLLPDGTALGIGGQQGKPDPDVYQLQTLLYDPVADTWSPMATQTLPRGYHTTAVLLPDGRVLSAGGTPASTDQLEIYSPPYLFKGPRPVITSAPASIVHGRQFTVATPDTVSRVVLMAPAANTHTNDMSQRHVELAFTARTGGVRVTAPPSTSVAPSSYYMLFLLNDLGVPSVASWVHL